MDHLILRSGAFAASRRMKRRCNFMVRDAASRLLTMRVEEVLTMRVEKVSH
jgi:hypothetical protein